MEPKNTEYCLLVSVSSVEEFLKNQFSASSNKLKKYFKKPFLNRSLNEKNTITLPLNFINDGLINPTYDGSPLHIIDENEHFFVFNKNPNQFIHPLTYDESDNCLSYLRQIRPELLGVNKANYDRGLLYRLDYETSGVVIYVKSESLYTELRKNFATVAKEKKYWCWVEGEMKLEGVFKHYFKASEEKGKRVKVDDEPIAGGMEGELSLKPIRFDSTIRRTLVEISLRTGLRHQIRAQLAFLGYALAGDTFYGGKAAKRLYLHALSYELDFDKKQFSWLSKPLDFEGI